MGKTNSIGFNLRQKTNALIISCMIVALSCSKPEENIIPVIPPTTPVSNTPSGVIQSFTINDTLVAFNTGSVIKWLVNGTNNLTVVTLNGIKVATYSSMETGPVKGLTVFTLEVNSGKKAILTLNAADSITSLLWSKGKSARLVKKEVFINPVADSSNKWGWIDTTKTITKTLLEQRVFFGLNNTVTTIQVNSSTSVSQGNAGKFIADPTGLYIWQGILYKIQSIDAINLVVTYDAAQPIGPKLLTRNTYLIE